MTIQKFAMAAGLLWLVLNYAIVRALERKDRKAETLALRLGLAASLGGAKTVRTSAAYAALVFGALWLVIVSAARHSALDLKTLHAAAMRVAGLKSWSDQFGSAWSWGVLGISIFSLVWLARTGARREVGLQFERALGNEIGRLVALRDAGELEELPPSPEMSKLLDLAVALLERRESHQREGVMTELVDGQIREIELRLSWLDLARRISETELLAKVERRLVDRPARIANVLASSGLSTALGKVGKAFSAIAAVVAMLSLVGVAGATATTALESKAIELDDLIIQASDVDLKERFERTLGTAQKQATSEQDRLLAKYLAQRLERGLVRADEWARKDDPSNEQTRRHEVRRQLLTLASQRIPQAARVAWEMVRSSGRVADPIRLVIDLPALKTEPTISSSLGTRIETDLLSIAEKHPSTWARLRSRFDAETAKFSRAASLGDVSGSLLGEALGQLLSGLTGSPDDIPGILAKDVLKAVGKKAVDRWYRERFHAFVTALGQGGSLEEATAQAMHGLPGYKAFANEDLAALRGLVLSELPTNATIAADLGQPSLVAIVDPTLTERVGSWGKAADVLDVRTSAALDTYDELFPASKKILQETLRGRLAQTRGLAQPVEELAIKRARNFRLLDSFNRVGGVVIGREAHGDALDIRKMNWSPSGRGGLLALVDAGERVSMIHITEASLIFLAAIYAADGRPTTVTITNAADVGAQKVHLHPALLGTALGCKAVQLDGLVFSRIENQHTWKKARQDVALDQSLYAETVLTALKSAYRPNAAIKLEPFLNHLEIQCRTSDGVCPLTARHAMRGGLGFNSSPVEGTKEVYSQQVVGVMRLCSGTETNLAGFQRCVQENGATQAWGAAVWENLISNVKNYCPGDDASVCAWRIIYQELVAPQSSTVSGVREREYTLADALSSEESGDDLSPLHFLIQVVFRPGMTRDDESEPWRFPALGDYAQDEVRKISNDPQTAKLLSEFREFTRIQRIFRAALDGKLGDSFPLEQIVDIANQTAASVTPAVVPTWINVPKVQGEPSNLAHALGVVGPAPDVALTCPQL